MTRPIALPLNVVVALVAFAVIGLNDAVLGAVLPDVRNAFGLTNATIAPLFYGVVSGQIVSTLATSGLMGRLGIHRTLLLGAGLMTGGLMGYSVAPVFAAMIACGVLLGVGVGLLDAGFNTLIASDPKHADKLGFVHGAYGIGALTSPYAARLLIHSGMSWRGVYGLICCCAGLVTIGLMLLRRLGVQPAAHLESPMPPPASLFSAVRSPAAVICALVLLVSVGLESSVGNWAFDFQIESRQTPQLAAGGLVSSYWIGFTAIRMLMSMLQKRFSGTRLLTASFILLPAALLFWDRSAHGYAAFPFIGAGIGLAFPMIMWLMPKRLPPNLVAPAIGLATCCGYLGSSTFASTIGWITSRYGTNLIPQLILAQAGLLLAIHLISLKLAPSRAQSPTA